MGCASSAPTPTVDERRKRLSVGGVDASSGEAECEATEDDIRGLLDSLNEKNIVEMAADKGGTSRRMSIGSSLDQGKTSFCNKTVGQLGDQLDASSIGLGFTCRKGLKPESPNQDSWFVLRVEGDSGRNCSIYAVMDGHGQKGHDVSEFVKDYLPKLVVKDPRFLTDDMPALLTDCFRKIQDMILSADATKKLSAQMSGTTCTLCVHDHDSNKITVAHVADSSCVLGTQGKGRGNAVQLTRDHKPNLTDERARIEKNGGRVVFDGYANHRVYARNARYPGLNMSRCLGDLMGHADCGITCEPEVTVRQLTAEDSVLLLCSDGVWEFIEPEEAVDIVSQFEPAKAQQAAEKLAKESWDRWIHEEGGTVVDDITVLAVYLQA